jgi:Flp pilus assembly protein TadD
MKTTQTMEPNSTAAPDGDLLVAGIRELSRGNDRTAFAAFERALAGSRDSTLGALCSARFLILDGRLDDARRVLGDLVEKRPDLTEAHYLLGRVHRDSFRMLDAVQSFREALRLDPVDRRAAAALGEILDVQEP